MQKNLFNQNIAEIEVRYATKVPAKDRPKVTSSADAVEILKSIWADSLELRESFYILVMNRANKVLGYKCISQGGLTGTVADPRIIFSIALKCNACCIVLAHNHPSGNLTPSASDIALTKNLVEAGKVLEITVLDHVIITQESFYSFADEGLI